MAVVHSQYNAILSETVSVAVTSATVVYFNLPWYAASYIDRIRIWNTSAVNTGPLNMVILNNGAHQRAGNITGKDHVLYIDAGTPTPLSTANDTFIYSINPPVYSEDLYFRPYICVRVTFSTGVSGTYYCNVQGRKASGATNVNTDATQIQISDDYRVLMGKTQTGVGYTGGSIIDATMMAIGNGGLANTALFAFEAITDKVYVGSKKKIDHFEFVLNTANSAGSALTAEYWNGSAWSYIGTNDNTSSGNSDSMKFSGIVEVVGIASSSWALTKSDTDLNFRIPGDPLTILQKQVVSGLVPPMLLPYNPERYWIRFGLSNLGSTVYIKNILPINEDY